MDTGLHKEISLMVGLGVSVFLFICACFCPGCGGNAAPDTPLTPSGPSVGTINTSYEFTSSAEDTDGDSIAIRFDWGDGQVSDWSDYAGSGSDVSMNYSFSDSNSYEIRAQARDQNEDESEWSGAHTIDIGTTALFWASTYGGTEDDYAYSVEECTDGDYIVAGQTKSVGAGGSDVYLIKVDTSGSDIYKYPYGGSSDDGGTQVQQTSDGGFIISGFTQSFGAGGEDVYLVKTNVWGVLEWDSAYGGAGNDKGNSVAQTSDGGYIITGYTTSFGAGGQDVYLIKTNSNGAVQWTQTYGGTSNEVGMSVAQTSDGYIIVGYTTSFGAGNLDVYLIKTDVNGDTLWTKTFGGPGTDRGNEVKVTSDNGFIIAAGNGDVYLIKTDADGNLMWDFTQGGASVEYSESVYETNSGIYISVGYTTREGNYDVYLVTVDASGSLIDDQIFTSTYSDYGYSIIQTSDNAYLIAGSTNSTGAGLYDAYLIKVAP